MPSFVHNEQEQGNKESIAPRLLEYANAVFKHLDPRLEKIARRAIGTEFYPVETEPPTIGLATNSFREQLAYQETKDPTILDRFHKWGIGAVVDSIKQQDVNAAGGDSLGDAYILRNLESIMAFAEKKNIDVMLGRYSGDELLAFFIPKEHISAKDLVTEFTDFNTKFLLENNPTNNALQKILPELQKTHGKDLQLGAHAKTIELSGVKYHTNKTHRERQLLGQVIDHVEKKGQRGGDKDLAAGLIENWKTSRTLSEPQKELAKLEHLLPPSVMELYIQAKKDGVEENTAASYAEDAVFEGLFPRLTVYRMEVFDEMLEKEVVSNESHGLKTIIAKAASPFLKWVNKYVSHAAGDYLMIRTAKTISTDNDTTTFQHRGSFVQLHTTNSRQSFELHQQNVQLSTEEPGLSQENYEPEGYTVITTQIMDENGELHEAIVDRNTSRETIWRYIAELGVQQTINEIAVLIARSGSFTGALENLIKYLDVRINRLDQSKVIATELEEKGQISNAIAKRIKEAHAELESHHFG